MGSRTEAEKRPRVWAIGGGKGGIGKSVLASSLGIAAAVRGRRCVLVDADLGGANLHTLLGLSASRVTLADLFSHQVATLRDLLLPTPVAGLQLVSGAGPLLEIANAQHAQKMKVIRQLFSLEADDVILDLGAGSSFTVLDFFLAAAEPIVIVVPTPTSVENAYHFLKAAFFRRLKQAIVRAGAQAAANRAMEEKVARGIHTPRDLLAEIARADAAVGAAVARDFTAFRPRLLVNQVRREEEMSLGVQMAEACHDFFGLEVSLLGAVRYDEKVYAAVQARRPVQLASPRCPFALAVDAIVGRLLDAGGCR